MSEQTAGFGPGSWLPRSVQLAWRQEAIAEARDARRAAEEKAEHVERRRSEDLTWAAQAAEARGEPLDPIALATGRVTGRSPGDILEHARMTAEAEDARAEAEARRNRGERLNLVGLLEDPATRDVPAVTTTSRAIERRAEAFRASVETRRAAEAADTALRRRVPSLGPSYMRPESSRPESRRSYAPPSGVTWAQVSDWYSRGWRP